MPSIKNTTQLEELKIALGKAKAIILADYSGLSVNDQTALRRQIKEAGGTLAVTKNTLMALALKDRLETSEDLKKALEGQTATLFTSDDPVSPTKALYKFTSEHEDKPVVKLGIIDDKILSISEVEALSKLPGREELLGMLVGQLNAPIAGFAQVLRANLQNLVFAIEAIRNKPTVNN